MLSASIAWLIELRVTQSFFWVSVAFFNHSGEHGIFASRWRSTAISWASDGDDFEVTGIGSCGCLGAELHPMRSNRVAGMSFVSFMVMP
jgi:hypothetical protein